MKCRANIFYDLRIRKCFLFGTLLVFAFFTSFAQLYKKEIGIILKQGDAKSLSAYFDKQIDLTFSDKTTTYSKKQAELILQKFFSKVEPSNFQTNHGGKSTSNNTQFSLGDMTTSNGVYKVYMFFIKRNGVYMMRELRFEK